MFDLIIFINLLIMSRVFEPYVNMASETIDCLSHPTYGNTCDTFISI